MSRGCPRGLWGGVKILSLPHDSPSEHNYVAHFPSSVNPHSPAHVIIHAHGAFNGHRYISSRILQYLNGTTLLCRMHLFMWASRI